MPGQNEGSIHWLVGRTRHVTATYFNERKWNPETGRFVGKIAGELGRYDIYIPETIVSSPSLSSIHMIPQRHQFSIDRHYHHYINTEAVTRHPLSYRTGNCWGDYEGPLASMLSIIDLPELFRQLYVHLCTYGYAPPKRTLDFNTTIPEA
jgi:hypothetical protein